MKTVNRKTQRVNLTESIQSRCGVAVLWLIGLLPVLVIMFGVMVDVARLWTGRQELENAIEAAALSGVCTWAIGGDSEANRMNARDDTITAGGANFVVGQNAATPATAEPVVIARNEDTVGGDTNDNADPDGELVLGSIFVNGSNEFTFCSNLSPGAGRSHAIRIHKVVTINSIWSELFGTVVGPYNIQASAVASFRNGQPRVVHVATYSSACIP